MAVHPDFPSSPHVILDPIIVKGKGYLLISRQDETNRQSPGFGPSLTAFSPL